MTQGKIVRWTGEHSESLDVEFEEFEALSSFDFALPRRKIVRRDFNYLYEADR